MQAELRIQRGTFSLHADLMIKPGTTLALLGPNGAGKSTAVAALAGLLPVERGGRIELNGTVVDDGHQRFVPPHQRRVGVVFQQFLLFPHLDVLDNVAFGLRHQGYSRRQSRAVAMDWLHRVNLETLAHRRPDSLSGGQAQRIAVLRALAPDPDLLLLDEPLSALDVSTRQEIRRWLHHHLQSFPGPRLLITHQPNDAFSLADDIVVLEDGVITQRGTPEHIRRHPATPYIADLTGLNLLTGEVQDHTVTIHDSSVSLTVPGQHHPGPVVARIRPRSVVLYQRSSPHERIEDLLPGSPRNVWPAAIRSIDYLDAIARVTVDEPDGFRADITPDAVDALGLEPFGLVWVAVKATDIDLDRDDPPRGAPIVGGPT